MRFARSRLERVYQSFGATDELVNPHLAAKCVRCINSLEDRTDRPTAPCAFILPSTVGYLPSTVGYLATRLPRALSLSDPIARRSLNASAAPAEQRVPSLQGCGGMEHSRWKGRWQAMEGPLAEAFEWALEAMEDRWK